jgi:hypothetical protein
MLKRFGFAGLVLCSSLAFAQPQVARAADRDDYRHEARYESRREGRDQREYAVRRERHEGYYDRYGSWHESGYSRR